MLAALRNQFLSSSPLARLLRNPTYVPPTSHFSSSAPPLPDSSDKPKAPAPISRWQRLKRERRARPTPENRTKHKYDRGILYDLPTALSHVRASQWATFDESLELILRLKIDPRQAEQNLRGVISLPHGTGRHDKVAVFADAEHAELAVAAGADLVGADELIHQIARDKGKQVKGFAECVVVPHLLQNMAASLGKLLGPKRLMPSQKTGTVTYDVENIIREIKRGRLSYRSDKEGNTHLHVGKLSFSDTQLTENIGVALLEILQIRPQTVKGKYILNAFICSSMGPSVMLDFQTLTRRMQVN